MMTTMTNLSSSLTLLSDTAGHGGSFWMPIEASANTAAVDGPWYFTLYVTAFFFVLIIGAMALFMWKYRARSDSQKTDPIKGSHSLEIFWAVAPSFLLVIMFFWGAKGWMDISVPPQNAERIEARAQQWNWLFTYSGSGVQTADELVVPVGRPIVIELWSQDVLHAFYIPSFRVKRDVIPYRKSYVWFTPTIEGTYSLFCAEYCGDDHSRMIKPVRVVSLTEYRAWLAENAYDPNWSAEVKGEYYFKNNGCAACHAPSNNGACPTLVGKYGTVEMLTDGSSVTVDDAYIRESMNDPGKKIVAGYTNQMPAFNNLPGEQYDTIIAYIKSLK
jgi:cytochrome c oxidase subunit 2